jgi:hypothetical protein
MIVQGHAYDFTGTPLPAGTPIRAFLDGVDYSNDSAVEDNSGSFSILVAGNWMLNQSTPETSMIKEGANLGETVLLAAGDFTNTTDVFQETVMWSPGGIAVQDLHLGAAATTPSAIKIQGIVTQPAQGGNQHAFLCNPTPAAVSLYDYYLEVDRPGTYHGASVALSGVLAAGAVVRVNFTAASFLVPTGDAFKLVYGNPGGSGSTAAGEDVVVDRIEFNATADGTLDWEPGNTILGDAPAPGPGRVLERSASCTDTNSASDFHFATEPGVPGISSVTVQISAPTSGQILTGLESFTFRWTMSDDVFLASYLRVWVNVTYGGASHPVASGAQGITSAAWTVPDVSDPSASVRVDVVDPFGSRASQVLSFQIQKSTPFAVLIAILVAVVILAFVLFALWNARRKDQAPSRPPHPPQSSPTAAAPAQIAPTPPPTAGTKICPRCSKEIRAQDDTCFYCGHVFVRPPS